MPEMMPTEKRRGSWAMKGIAHDPASGTFFVGSIYKRKIVAIREASQDPRRRPPTICTKTQIRTDCDLYEWLRPSGLSPHWRRTSSSTAQAKS